MKYFEEKIRPALLSRIPSFKTAEVRFFYKEDVTGAVRLGIKMSLT